MKGYFDDDRYTIPECTAFYKHDLVRDTLSTGIEDPSIAYFDFEDGVRVRRIDYYATRVNRYTICCIKCMYVRISDQENNILKSFNIGWNYLFEENPLCNPIFLYYKLLGEYASYLMAAEAFENDCKCREVEPLRALDLMRADGIVTEDDDILCYESRDSMLEWCEHWDERHGYVAPLYVCHERRLEDGLVARCSDLIFDDNDSVEQREFARRIAPEALIRGLADYAADKKEHQAWTSAMEDVWKSLSLSDIPGNTLADKCNTLRLWLNVPADAPRSIVCSRLFNIQYNPNWVYRPGDDTSWTPYSRCSMLVEDLYRKVFYDVPGILYPFEFLDGESNT